MSKRFDGRYLKLIYNHQDHTNIEKSGADVYEHLLTIY